MQLRDSEIRGIPVHTKGGEKVGKLRGVVVESGTHAVAYYVVARPRLLTALLPDELLIAPRQVIEFDAEHMVVDDGAVPEAFAARAARRSHASSGHAHTRDL